MSVENPLRALAQRLDQADELRVFREHFVATDPDLIYLDGNSLGRLPKATAALLQDVIERQWGDRLIRSWNEGWIDAPLRVGNKLAQLLGAQPGEVTIADSTTVNLFKLALAALRAQSGRHKIVTDDLNFPSDLYALQGICQLLGPDYSVEVVPSPDGIHGPVEALAQAIDDDTALLTLSHTVFKSAYTYDMAAMTELAHCKGALVLWDLSHAAGSVVVDLGRAHTDLAVGCTYKYLNGGPGAPAFLYVRHDLQDLLTNPIQGWMGQANLFNFGLAYERAPGLSHFLTGTPPILSTLAIEPGVDLLLAAGIERVRAKSVQQSDYLLALWEAELAPLGFVLNSPRASQWRGSHLSLGHPEAWRIDQALIHARQVLPDFREPDNIRLGITPLYTSFVELYEAVMRIKQVVHQGLYLSYSQANMKVT
ncbi:MAG: kynureninase [Caldilineaceae bacterium]|nr:kynureninase [Caldilineaceae bacterium]